ncbi:MAG TPA: hypothetical protein VD968_10160 [Pyrinomonadaceae bacterium]|nr:hypothetical protein [Pyrinomonadaceae bacterium]
MTESTGRQEEPAGTARGEEDEGLQAEEESAAAMDADVPQPPGASETTEGQPS